MIRAVILNGEFIGTTTSSISFEERGFWELAVLREPQLTAPAYEDVCENPVFYRVSLTQPFRGMIKAAAPDGCEREAVIHALESNLKNFRRVNDSSPAVAAKQLLDTGVGMTDFLRAELIWIAGRP